MDRERANPSNIVVSTDLIKEALREAVREALRRHKLLGNPVAVWENGQLTWLAPDQIPDPGD